MGMAQMKAGETVFVCHDTDTHIFITTFRTASSSFKVFFNKDVIPRNREELLKVLRSGKTLVVILREPVSRYLSALKLVKMILRGSGTNHMDLLMLSHSAPYMDVFLGVDIRYIRWENIGEYLPYAGFSSLSELAFPDYYTLPVRSTEHDIAMGLEVETYTKLLANNREMESPEFLDITA
jgi:hypothetical protein|tara:strand:- start:337 stop:876 length:540 start_codon:yes stop_codon:yes gene_type:complete